MGKILKFTGKNWKGVEEREYKSQTIGNFKGVKRINLSDFLCLESIDYEARVFVVEPQGYTSLEYHEHLHLVVILMGEAHVLIKDQVFKVRPLDVVVINSNELHRFYNPKKRKKLAFLCLVNKKRDKPSYPNKDEILSLISSNPGLKDILLL